MLALALCSLIGAAALNVAAVPLYMDAHESVPLLLRQQAGTAVPLYRQAPASTDVEDNDSEELTVTDNDDNDDLQQDIYDDIMPQCETPGTNGQACNVTAYTTCDMREVGVAGCSLANITGHPVVNIIPGNNTHCLNASSEYFFQVQPGESHKLVIWFHGGGACWSNNISAPGACAGYPDGPNWTFYVNPTPYTYTGGLFNRSHDDAPFDDFTFVVLPYCSGDMFVGNTVREYKNATTNETIAVARQSGSNNTMAALSWVFENYPNVTQLLIGGCSAGSLGSQTWAAYIYQHYNRSLDGAAPRTAVLADGYVGIFPENQRSIIRELNAYQSPWAAELPPDLQERMENGMLYWCEITNYIQDHMPDATFAALQGAHDIVQLSYFNVLAAESNKSHTHEPDAPACASEAVPVYDEEKMGPSFFMSSDQFFNVTQDVYKGYMERGVNNFVPYIVSTTQHCFMGYQSLHTLSIVDHGTGRNVTLLEWLSDISVFEDDDTNLTDDEDDYYPVCDAKLPCTPDIFNASMVPGYEPSQQDAEPNDASLATADDALLEAQPAE